MNATRLILLWSLALAVSGCASLGGGVGRGAAGPDKVQIGDISNLPQVTLPGASMEQARSVAMAAAQARGWDIAAADANRVLLERPLAANSPQAQAVPSPLAPPRMQVETALVERGDGTIAALRAFLVANPGTADEQRIDYTSDYQNQLLISLSSLSSAWIAARDEINSEIPVLAEFDADAGDTEDAAAAAAPAGEVLDNPASGADGTATAAAPASPPAPAPVAPRASAPVAPRTVQPPAPAAPTPAQVRQPTPPQPAQTVVAPAPVQTPAPAAPASTAATGVIAPTIPPPASPTLTDTPSALRPGPSPSGSVASPAPIAPTVPAEVAGSNDMLVLNQGGRKGLWSYYAEDYARLRGCNLGDRGAMLLREQDGFEVHEIECTGASNILVQCRGGVCEPLR